MIRRFVLAASLLLLAGCSQDFWDRSPRVAGEVQGPGWAVPPVAPSQAPSAQLPPPRVLPGPGSRQPASATPPPVGETWVPQAGTPGNLAPSYAGPEGGRSAEREAHDLLSQVNTIRSSRGLRSFTWNDRLQLAARDHSAEQDRHGYMGHGSPDPRRETLVQRIEMAGYQGVMFGEVVAWGYRDVAAVVEGWMHSPDHRAILLDPDLKEAGFSRVGSYWTGNFGARLAAPNPRPTRAQRPATPRPTYVPPRQPAPAPVVRPAPQPAPRAAPPTRRYFQPPQAATPRPAPARPAPRGG